jgi:hypothetical protein
VLPFCRFLSAKPCKLAKTNNLNFHFHSHFQLHKNNGMFAGYSDFIGVLQLLETLIHTIHQSAPSASPGISWTYIYTPGCVTEPETSKSYSCRETRMDGLKCLHTSIYIRSRPLYMECYNYNQLRIISRIHAIDIHITYCFLSIAAGSLILHIQLIPYILTAPPPQL